MTLDSASGDQKAEAYLEGAGAFSEYWDGGVDGYVSMVGHRESAYQSGYPKGSPKAFRKNFITADKDTPAEPDAQ